MKAPCTVLVPGVGWPSYTPPPPSLPRNTGKLKLSPEQATEIRRLVAQGLHPKAIGFKYSVHASLIRLVCRGSVSYPLPKEIE
ncbi:MAG: hypothetical protein JZU60_02780 [Ilumatobacteraceae bacterium]|nr:hypothetical protein [Ilumatobacteraceae bacterium]